MELEDTAGHAVALGEVDGRGRVAVLLFFMRSASCPVCNMHVKELIKHADEYAAAGVQIVIAVPECREQAAEWKSKKRIPFSVVTGRQGSAHEAVGLTKMLFGSIQQSGSLLIDSHNIVRHAHGATMPISSYGRKGIAAVLDELRAAADS